MTFSIDGTSISLLDESKTSAASNSVTLPRVGLEASHQHRTCAVPLIDARALVFPDPYEHEVTSLPITAT